MEYPRVPFGESFMNKNVFFVFIVAMLVVMPGLGFASESADQEITTAMTHAQMATDAADVATATMHFHHVINCLVGPKSKLFDAAVGNPCKDMGKGALNDVGKKSAEHVKLSHALAIAEQALQAKKLEATQQYATRIAKVLKSINLEQ
ncbi:MAG: hypothetical protein ACRESO_01855 [Gammaproteobacteria bacterium]